MTRNLRSKGWKELDYQNPERGVQIPGLRGCVRSSHVNKIEIVEPSHKHFRTEHPEPFRRFSRGELS